MPGRRKAGHVVGGRVFGYRIRTSTTAWTHGNPLRSHVEREIDPGEAAVVRRIFALYDSGEGLKRIAKPLTARARAAPKPFVRRDPTKVQPVVGWSPSTVRAILTRELYRGVIVWNKTRKRPITWGQVDQRPRPESEWLRTPAEHLRIVDEDLWKRVQSRRRRPKGGPRGSPVADLSGRPPKTATRICSPGWPRARSAAAA